MNIFLQFQIQLKKNIYIDTNLIEHVYWFLKTKKTIILAINVIFMKTKNRI